MGRYVYDRIYDAAEDRRRRFENVTSTEAKAAIISQVEGAAQEFASIADEWETWATEKANEMVEKGEL